MNSIPMRAAPQANWQRERLRQQALVSALLHGGADEPLPGWLGGPEGRVRRGLQAYVANAGAVAERALAASFPTVRALLGDEAFAGMSRAYWRRCPPSRGDLAWLGDGLPAFIAANELLAAEPYLADCASLDWAAAQAESATDAVFDGASLALLGEAEPAVLHLLLRPGTAVVVSSFPIVALWLAHREAEGPARSERFGAARDALAAGRGECAVVARDGWRVDVQAVSPAAARFTAALLGGRSLADALGAADDGFDFTTWLADAVTRAWLVRVQAHVPSSVLQDRSLSP